MINETNNQIIELSVNELEKISGGGFFGRDINRTPEEEAQENEILASLQESQNSGVDGIVDRLKAKAQAYMK
jgi:bacteriocin-like protein